MSQVMCSYLATSSAMPVLLGHRPLLTMAANMVLATLHAGHLPTLPCFWDTTLSTTCACEHSTC